MPSLTNGQEYDFRLTATNSGTNSTPSTIVSAIPVEQTVFNLVTNIEYNAAGLKEKVEYGNGNTTDYEYDDRLRLIRIHTTDVATVTIQDLKYEYDGVGNITKIMNEVENKDQDFIYDEIGRLLSATGEYTPGQGLETKNYQYNPIGNLINKDNETYGYETDGSKPVHGVTAIGTGESFDYDANGNMVQQITGSVTKQFIFGRSKPSRVHKRRQ